MQIPDQTRRAHSPDPARPSAWSPFRYPAFSLLWTVTLISNIGTWMNDVGAGWLMTELSHSPSEIALVQAATTAPVFLFVLLAGALADRVDKRRYLIGVNLMVLLVVTALAIVTATGLMSARLLLAFAFALGTGTAFMAPAMQALVPMLVPREHLSPAIALNSLGVKIGRAVGPVVAGVLISSIGLASPFIASAIGTMAIVAALMMWRPAPAPPHHLPAEPFAESILTGLRHAAHNDALKATLLRAFGFFSFASAFWALLPLIARSLPGGSASLYGLLLGAVGAGAVIGALLLPRIREKVGINRLTGGGTIVAATAMLLMGLAWGSVPAIVAALLAGFGWITVLTSLNLSAQMALANWVRARGLSVALMVFYGSMAAGATFWGQVASLTSARLALALAAGGAVMAIPLTRRARLGQGEGRDLTPPMG
ncbi:MFS transporter [Paracoccus sp. NGMCC 1.201697]|uniref:MFS transporter n=1 Tax=Paracoccus broussonetiae subsp. drimophilus TaxID=3373869 RepID=A0ABW7LNU0_9RHOB